MRLHIRTLFLTVALLCGLSSTARACCFIPLLDPLHWLFGCSGGYGPGQYCGPGYGYGQPYGNGYGYGGWHGGNPYAAQRFIDDWLGYGYLRNQQGTLGHYPGRPFACYQPLFPRLFAPCAPCAPTLAMQGPMVAPLQAPMMMPAPMPTMHNPCVDPCQQPYTDPCLPAPMVQCQPMPVPVTTWRPMTVDRGHWTRVWVPRPITTMVPQTQYMSAAPMMQAPMMDQGCGNDCGGAVGQDYGTMMQGTMMPGMNIPGAPSDAGCCGSEGEAVQEMPMNGVPASPQSTMMMSPGMNSWSPQYAAAPYTSMSRWYSAPSSSAWSPMGGYPSFANGNSSLSTMPLQAGRRQRLARRDSRRMASQFGWQNGVQSMTAHVPPTMTYGRPIPTQNAYAPVMYGQQAYVQPMYGQAQYPQPQQFGWQASPMTAQYMPQAYAPMQSAMLPGQNFAGDIMGDHELAPTSSVAVPVIPNSFGGTIPLVPATWTNSGLQTVRRYNNSVR